MSQETRIFVLAENYQAAFNYANKLSIPHWTYCSYIEQISGLRNGIVYLAPNWRQRKCISTWYLHLKQRGFQLYASASDNTLLEQPRASLP